MGGEIGGLMKGEMNVNFLVGLAIIFLVFAVAGWGWSFARGRRWRGTPGEPGPPERPLAPLATTSPNGGAVRWTAVAAVGSGLSRPARARAALRTGPLRDRGRGDLRTFAGVWMSATAPLGRGAPVRGSV